MREKTYWPELCVVQLAGTADVAVVDAQAPGHRPRPARRLLAKPDVVKVFHAARQDVEIFLLLFGAVPAPLFDTQVAAMVAGFGDQVGYDRLVQSLTGGHIDKAHRFSDWSARPLSAAQVDLCRRRRDPSARASTRSWRAAAARKGAWPGWREEMALLADPATYRAGPGARGSGCGRAPTTAACWRWCGHRRLARARGAAHQHPAPAAAEGRAALEIAATAPRERRGADPRARRLRRVRQGQDGPVAAGGHRRGKALPEGDCPKIERAARVPRSLAGPGGAAESAADAAAEQNNVAPRLVASGEEIEALAQDESAPNPCCKAGAGRCSARMRCG